MGIRQISKILGDIQVRRVDGGDSWVDRANAELGIATFTRNMTGEEIAAKYSQLNPEQQIVADAAFTSSDAEINELVEEVYRIKEDIVEIVKDSNKDSYLQVFGLILSMLLTAFALIATFLVIMATLSNKDIPDGYVLQMGKALMEYLINEPNGTGE